MMIWKLACGQAPGQLAPLPLRSTKQPASSFRHNLRCPTHRGPVIDPGYGSAAAESIFSRNWLYGTIVGVSLTIPGGSETTATA